MNVFRVLDETDEDDTDSEDVTSLQASELRSDIVRGCDISVYGDLPASSTQDTSLMLLSNPIIPVRERGYSLSAERTPGLLRLTAEPRSKSLRIKRHNKDV